jgi:hypothetical protein
VGKLRESRTRTCYKLCRSVLQKRLVGIMVQAFVA